MDAPEQDRRIGEALAALRGTRSQQSVADFMRDRGWKWSQSTVWSVERGDRPLRLAEADELAKFLDCSVPDFFQAPGDIEEQRNSAANLARLKDAFRDVVAAVRNLDAARGPLYWLEIVDHEGKSEMMTYYIRQAAEQLKRLTLARAIEQAEAEIDQAVNQWVAPDHLLSKPKDSE